jgi:DNA mismatch repair protein MutL
MTGDGSSRGAEPRGRIRILRDEVSRKIAAGEVIDRPLSIVRELLDNAIDAGASTVDVYLEEGGISRVRVTDDGAGMDRDDLALCWQAHATSKIESEDDLLRVTSLGFRGEALSSIATAARLEIVSRPAAPGEDGREPPAHRLVVRGGALASLEPGPGRAGTTVDVSELFSNYPARRKFLRSASSESALCRSMFVDRAVAHPSVSFRLFVDGELRLSFLPAPLLERVGAAYGQMLDARLLREAGAEGEGFTVRMVAGLPDLRRRDRRLLQSFVNRRRVWEFALVQAAEHAFEGRVPGGWHPAAFAFVDIDPGLVDFNIHPAKKEVRFRSLAEVHRAVVAAGRTLLAQAGAATPSRGTGLAPSGPGLGLEPRAVPPVLPGRSLQPRGQTASVQLPQRSSGLPARPADQRIRFLGQVFGVFLAFELPDRLILLDQHAAHERLLFERFLVQPPVPQEMLFPLSFDVSDGEDARLSDFTAGLQSAGIVVRRAGRRTWEVAALAADYLAIGEADLVEMLRDTGAGDEERWKRDLLARAACRLAVKEGDPVDPVTAAELCAGVLGLDNPRCPHGRPIWHEITRETLYGLVDRPAEGDEPRGRAT